MPAIFNSFTTQIFENQIKDYFKAVGVFTFWKGRVALYTALKALNIGRGDAVMIAGYTCVVVPAAVKALQAKSIFVDIDARTYNINPELLDKSWQPNVKALIVQHTYGIPAEMKPIQAWARQKNIPIIEDCCHSFGSFYEGQLLGTFGEAAFFSTQWSKPFTTGLGGILVVHSEELAQSVTELLAQIEAPSTLQAALLFGQYLVYKSLVYPRTYALAMLLYHKLSENGLLIGSSENSELQGEQPEDYFKKMSNMQAWIGKHEFRKLKKVNQHRSQLADFYCRELPEYGFKPVPLRKGEEVGFLRYPVQVKNKTELLKLAAQKGVEIGSWFECPLHPIESDLSAFGYHAGDCPVAEKAASEVINLPTHNRVSLRQAERILKFLSRYAAAA
ncbi:MAG: DegT/DnrJ/EryC1/StrS family aminotransferase [Desulfobacterales bacterium]